MGPQLRSCPPLSGPAPEAGEPLGPCEETDGCSRAEVAFRQLIFEGLCLWTPFACGSGSLAAASYCSAACESCWELLQHGWCTLQSERLNAASGIIHHGEGAWPPSWGPEAGLPSAGPTSWHGPAYGGCPLGTLLLPSKQPCLGRESELLLFLCLRPLEKEPRVLPACSREELTV